MIETKRIIKRTVQLEDRAEIMTAHRAVLDMSGERSVLVRRLHTLLGHVVLEDVEPSSAEFSGKPRRIMLKAIRRLAEQDDGVRWDTAHAAHMLNGQEETVPAKNLEESNQRVVYLTEDFLAAAEDPDALLREFIDS